MSVFEVRSSDEDITRANDRFSKADGYHAVPPPITRNFLTSRADISFAGLDEFAIRKKIIESKTTELKTATSESKTSETVGKTNKVNVEKPKSVNKSVVSTPNINMDKVIIDDWNSDDENDVSAEKTVSHVKTYKTQTVKTQADKIDCDFYDQKSPEPKLKNVVNTGPRVVKPVWDNAKRVNHQKFSNKLKYPQARRTFVPSGVLTRIGFVNPVWPNEKRVVHTGRPPSISFMRPFGCPLTILNTLDPLGKFDGKSDEGYLLGYSTSSSSGKDKEPTQEYILLPLHHHRPRIFVEDDVQVVQEKDVHDSEDVAENEEQHKLKDAEQALNDDLESMIAQEIAAKAMDATSINKLNTGRSSVSTSNQPLVNTANTPLVSAASTPTGANAGGSSFVYLGGQINIEASTLPNADLPYDPNMPDLEDDSDIFPNDGIFSGAFDDGDVGAVADFNNMDNTIDVSPIHTLRIHQHHPKDQILVDPKSAVQTRGKIQKASSVSMIGSLMYLTALRPDIMFAVRACARFQVTPKDSHLQALLPTTEAEYVAAASYYGQTFSPNDLMSQGFNFLVVSIGTGLSSQVSTTPCADEIDEDDLEELDLIWQVAMLTVRVKKFIQKTGRNLDFKGKQTVGFDKRNAPTNDSSSQALVAQDGLGGYDWSNDFEVEPVNYALMAISSSSSSSSSENQVQNCSKQCLESFNNLQKNYDSKREKRKRARLEIQGYELALGSLESKILGHEKNEMAWGEKYEFQNYDFKYEMSNKSETDSEISMSVFEVRSSDEDITTIRLSIHLVVYNEELAIPEQTATEGKLKENQGCRVDTDQVHQNGDLKNRSV
ncbi:hypothetical protein Tco_1531046 [Tanacetum coccineum]